MTLLRQLCVSFLLLLSTVAGLAAGDSAKVSAPDQVRVLSQTVGTDEMLLALARPEQIAGLSYLATDSRYCAVSEQAASYPRLSQNGDAETALKLKPTVVLCADYSRMELIHQLQRAGITTIIFKNYKTLEDSFENLRTVAHLLGAEDKAERIIANCRERVARLQLRMQGVKPVRVVAPSIYGVIPGADTTFQDLCDRAGADNLAWSLGHLKGHVPPPGESMLTWPVDRLVIAGSDVKSALEPYRSIPPYQYMPALREERVILVPTFILSCVTFHRVDAYEIMAKAVHPELFRTKAQD